MTTIQFTHGATIQVEDVQLNGTGDTIFAGGGHSYDAYELSGIKSIIPPRQKEVPTKLQNQFIKQLSFEGYKWDKQHSISAAGTVLKRWSDGDFWFFGLDGEIMHNPDGISIPVPKTSEKKWVRYRFHTDSDDWRPVKYNPSYPSWKTGESYEGDKSVILAYLPATESLEDYWPEACCIDSEPCDGPVFTSRFPKPKDYVPIEL